MGDWKKERDALVTETMAFVQAVRSKPISIQQKAALQSSDDAEKVAAVLADPPQPLSDQTVDRHRLQPMKWGGPEREEIRQRVAAFKAHQERLIREREGYAVLTLGKMKATREQITELPMSAAAQAQARPKLAES
jgi:hypothetical protein